MSRPSVSQAQRWRPDSLREAADAWDGAAYGLQVQVDVIVRGVQGSRDFWTGSAAESARDRAEAVAGAARRVARALVTAAVAARDGAEQMAQARDSVLAVLAEAGDGGFVVADDGTASPPAAPPALLTTLTGGDAAAARETLAVRAADLTRQIQGALDRLGAADADAAGDIDEALAAAQPSAAATTRPAGAWPVNAAEVVAAWPAMSQDRIAAQVAAMTPEQRHRLIDEMPKQVGNTDGVPWDMRTAANRINIANAILDEDDHDRDANHRIAFYQGLLGEVDDPARSGRRLDRQILAFDPDRSSLIELTGDLNTATGVAVLVPGLNTTVEGSAANTETARRFVAASRGDVAMITYLGGPFPTGNLVAGIVDAANPRYALDMAPRLVAFSEDVDRTVAATGRGVPVTYIGHSYGGSILGTAEELGLTADRMLYVEAAGAGIGVDDPGDRHNRNPDVLRFSMTAPGDPIEAVQGIPLGPHGADPDGMAGVVRLATGHRLDGRLMAGLGAHSDVVNEPSDAWRNILAVITGDRDRLHEVS